VNWTQYCERCPCFKEEQRIKEGSGKIILHVLQSLSENQIESEQNVLLFQQNPISKVKFQQNNELETRNMIA
jgi:hypothetical protein